MRTYSAKPNTIQQNWYIVDASEHNLGRLATKIAVYLRGKHKPEYTPHVDTGDYVVVINAAKIKVTGAKEQAKMYHQHSGYPGGMRSESLATLREKAPERIIEAAVKGMLPKGPLGRQLLKKLKVYPGTEHPHAAQQPQVLKIEE